MTYAGAKLKPASCPVVPFVFQAALTADAYGINFSRAISADDSAADLQAEVEYAYIEHVKLPDFSVPDEGWRAAAYASTSTFANGEDDQHIRIDSFDGSLLRWTVDKKEFGRVRGALTATQGDERTREASCFEATGSFRGLLHFECLLCLPPTSSGAAAASAGGGANGGQDGGC